mgnify:CR=1 FL=1
MVVVSQGALNVEGPNTIGIFCSSTPYSRKSMDLVVQSMQPLVLVLVDLHSRSIVSFEVRRPLSVDQHETNRRCLWLRPDTQ